MDVRRCPNQRRTTTYTSTSLGLFSAWQSVITVNSTTLQTWYMYRKEQIESLNANLWRCRNQFQIPVRSSPTGHGTVIDNLGRSGPKNRNHPEHIECRTDRAKPRSLGSPSHDPDVWAFGAAAISSYDPISHGCSRLKCAWLDLETSHSGNVLRLQL
ncbi:hypothetical protein BJX64DRAFT_801 [Aspergillus heterothallicus]